MFRLYPTIGGLLILLGIVTALPSAYTADLYKEIRASVQQEMRKDSIEDDVATFVAETIRTERPAWSAITKEDVLFALKGELSKLCAKGPKLGAIGGGVADAASCLNLANEMVALARREQDLRSFGRTLQALASRDELPVEGLRADAANLVSHEQAILHLWKAGNGTVKTGNLPDFRDILLTQENIAGAAGTIAGNLASLPKEQAIAAVWRYRYGVRLVRGDRLPAPAPSAASEQAAGTERQWLLGRWPGIEGALQQIWGQMLSSAGEMNLQDGEYGVLFAVPIARGAEGLLGTVLVWGFIDHDMSGVHPMGDVGLRWDIATEPVLPSLLAGGPIPGGSFPPSAQDGRGLCGNPLNAQGYLCRPIDIAKKGVDDDEDMPGPCLENPLQSDTAISLTSCTDITPGVQTHAGPEICAGIDWHTVAADDVDYACSLRKSVGCADACPDDNGNLSPDEEWHSYGKNPDGVVRVCLRESGGSLPFRYNLMRALAIADSVCAAPPGASIVNDPQTGCCRLLGDGTNAMCRMMYDDGVFTDTDGSPAVSKEDIPFTVQNCSEALTQEFCSQRGDTCPTSRDYKPNDEDNFVEEIYVRAKSGAAGSESCTQAAEQAIDPRNFALINAIDTRDDIGQPGRTITYLNTIGNQICAAGGYIEEAAKRHSLVGGRIPYTVMDQSFPWTVDGLADERDDGITALLKPLEGSTSRGGPLPSYRPQLLTKMFDTALCGALGLPPRQPSELCMLDAQQRFALPLSTFLSTYERSTTETDDVRAASDIAERGGAAVGTQMVNGYYGDYLHGALRTLADVLGTTDELLDRLRLQSSPGLMCPGENTPTLEGGSTLSVGPSPASSRASSFSSIPAQ